MSSLKEKLNFSIWRGKLDNDQNRKTISRLLNVHLSPEFSVLSKGKLTHEIEISEIIFSPKSILT